MAKSLGLRLVGGAAGLAILSGCESYQSFPTDETTASSATATMPSTEAAPATGVTDPLEAYLTSPDRIERYLKAVQDFGQVVLSRPAAWGGFDDYCVRPSQNGTADGYTSEGFVPQGGDDCSTQHTPAYGAPDIQLTVNYIYGTEQFYAASADTPECNNADASYVNAVDKWVGTYALSADNPGDYSTTEHALSPEEARQIDDYVIGCLDNTRP
ncbi:MAG: hypothetical protein JWM37_436 [Candidatus Saccharibacteria bacterium]|nr:hypothetical protein [Candidatus Saccharibacteria bacterium]